jgi:hypothetical protein
MSTSGNSAIEKPAQRAADERRFVQLIDLHTGHPAELARLLDQWRTRSLKGEHIAEVEVRHDCADAGHLVLQVEYESPGEIDEQPAISTEAAAVVGLLDAPPRFRSS